MYMYIMDYNVGSGYCEIEHGQCPINIHLHCTIIIKFIIMIDNTFKLFLPYIQ